MKIKEFIITVALILGLNTAWAAEPFAVVELFASEGCSSCPPADELIIKLDSEVRPEMGFETPVKLKKRIFTLSFQVDYWDYLGWKDPYSQAAFTERQRQYADVLKSNSIYTPQMIINGQEAFVGSDERKARSTINQFLKISAVLSIDLKEQLDKNGVLRINYHLSQLPQGAVLNIALADNLQIEHPIKAGENQGRMGRHANLVLDFKTVPLNSKDGEVEFTGTSNMSMISGLAIIAYVQDLKSMKILGAEKLFMY